MVSCGLACPGGGGAGVSGCEFRGPGWGWDRRCQDPGARGLGPGGGGGSWGTIPYWGGGGGVATRNTGPYIYIQVLWGTMSGEKLSVSDTPVFMIQEPWLEFTNELPTRNMNMKSAKPF